MHGKFRIKALFSRQIVVFTRFLNYYFIRCIDKCLKRSIVVGDRDRGIKEFADLLMAKMVFGWFINWRTQNELQSLLRGFSVCQMELMVLKEQQKIIIKYKLQSQVTT